MGKEKQGALVAGHQNPFTHIETKYNEIETLVKTWLAKQSIPVETAIVTFTSAVQGAAIGGLMSTFTKDISSAIPPPPSGTSLNPQANTFSSFQQAQALAGGPLIQARNFAVMTGVNAGLSCVLRRLKGKEDVQTSMVAAFGSGVMFSLVSGMGGPTNQASNVITSGVFFALMQGGIFKVGEKFSKPKVEDILYNETRGMLYNLGLERYEKNFRRGLLTDNTLPLLNDRQVVYNKNALQDVKIPPGPRLLILDHIEREKEVKKMG
ncbi:hypothetical protein LXL04_021551 [Taraxacum kok-saghyz]